MNKFKINVFTILLFFTPFILMSQNKDTINNDKEKIIGDVKKYANKAADYIGELFRIQGPAPKNYIKASKITFLSEDDLKNVVKIKNVEPEYQLKLLYPRIQYGKGFISFLIGDFKYFKYLNKFDKANIEYIKLRTKNSECNVKKYVLFETKQVKRNVCFLLDHSGSMGNKRANALQEAVYNSIVNHKSNKDKYSIVKFDNTSSVIVSSDNIDEISNNFKRNVGLEGFGGGTGIEDAILQSINLLISDSTSKSKLIVLFTDGETNSKLSQLTLDEIIKKSLENNINIITVGYGTHVNNQFLENISNKSGGNLYRIYNKDEFDVLFDNIMVDLEKTYNIEFTPCMFGEEIEIEIKIKGRENPLIGKTIFRSPPKKGYSIDMNVVFSNNSFEIDNKFIVDLDKFTDYLKSNTKIKILIEGHTDKIGEGNLNLLLSQNRADNVKKYFLKKGIKDNRIITKGYGESMPAYPYLNNNESNDLNRRIEIKIIE